MTHDLLNASQSVFVVLPVMPINRTAIAVTFVDAWGDALDSETTIRR